MQTPFGTLNSIDLGDTETCLRILREDKHQLLEGLVIESILDQIVEHAFASKMLAPVPVTMFVARRVVAGRERQGCAFVWYEQREPSVEKLLDQVSKAFSVFPVKWDESSSEFLTTMSWHKLGCHEEPSVPLHVVLRSLLKCHHQPVFVQHSVRDAKRQNQAIWGFLVAHYGEALGRKVVLPRIFKNYGIQPYFNYAWDVDRLVTSGDQLWFLEIKHKYPMGRSQLSFGINVGEFRLIADLRRCAVNCLHAIAVKPIWDKGVGAQYLLSSISARERVALLAMVLDDGCISAVSQQEVQRSGSHTTFTGQGAMHYYSLPIEWFHNVGLLSMPAAKLASALGGMLTGEIFNPVTAMQLRDLRLNSW